MIFTNIKKIVKELKKGNLVIARTDTIYGIYADALNLNAVEKVFEAKVRDRNKPLIILVSSIEMLREYILKTSDLEDEIITKYWPSKLTILFLKNKKIDNIITANSHYVGIRYPNDSEIIKIINELGNPVISTSANISGSINITNINNIPSDLKKHISYIDGELPQDDIPSSLIQIKDGKIKILRDGEISRVIKEEYGETIDNEI